MIVNVIDTNCDVPRNIPILRVRQIMSPAYGRSRESIW
jgi:hypothetical protein